MSRADRLRVHGKFPFVSMKTSIAIGSRGTWLFNRRKDLPRRRPLSKRGEALRNLPLRQAVKDGQVFHIPEITWTSGKRRFRGEAFFPMKFTLAEMPVYVAARARGWDHGCVE